MQLIRGWHNLRNKHRYCVATIGNFDGVHLGHQAVFESLQAKALSYGLPSTVILFEPQPMEFFQPEQAPARLTRLREKLIWIRHYGIQRVLLLEFNIHLAQMEADQFVQRILLDGLAIQYLFVGDDFRFGRHRQGHFAFLQNMGDRYGFGVEKLPTLSLDGQRISSTRIRQALERGDLAEAKRCLGRDYQLCGRVAQGQKRGRQIGFPTLNIPLHRRISPLRGVFAVRVHGLSSSVQSGIANIGYRPTIGDRNRPLLEVHLFDFDRQVYGQSVQVDFIQMIRPEKKFASFAALKQQIEQDVQQAKQIFNPHSV